MELSDTHSRFHGALSISNIQLFQFKKKADKLNNRPYNEEVLKDSEQSSKSGRRNVAQNDASRSDP